MFINQKIAKFLIFLFCFSIFSSISQANEDIPLNNIVIGEEFARIIGTVDFLDKKFLKWLSNYD